MIRTQVYLPDEIYQELKFLAVTGEKNISQLIRECAEAVINKKKASKVKNKNGWKEFIGAAKGGCTIDGVKAISEHYEKDIV